MTASLHRNDRQVLTASPVAIGQARQVVETLTEDRSASPIVESSHGPGVPLPHELSAIVARILEILSAGGTVTVGAMPENLTTTAAANVLGVSRPTLMKMIQRNEIVAHKVGSHTRLRTEDVLVLREVRRRRQRDAFDSLRALEDGE